jgi:organic radical activating enzyme
LKHTEILKNLLEKKKNELVADKDGLSICSHYNKCRENCLKSNKSSILIYVNQQCKRNCSYCSQSIKFNTNLDVNKIDECFNYAKDYDRITILGGEFCILPKEVQEKIFESISKFNLEKKVIIKTAQYPNIIPKEIKVDFHITDFSFSPISDIYTYIHNMYTYNIVLYKYDFPKIILYLKKYSEFTFFLYFNRTESYYSKEDIELYKQILSFKNTVVPFKYFILEHLDDINEYISYISKCLYINCCKTDNIYKLYE